MRGYKIAILSLTLLTSPQILKGEITPYLYEGCKLYPFSIAKKWKDEKYPETAELLKLSKEDLDKIMKDYQCKADNLKYYVKLIEENSHEDKRN